MTTKKSMNKDDIACLLELIQDNPAITSKVTNAFNNKLKEDAWVNLTAAFNVQRASIPRSTYQLKLKWDNLKKTARKRAQQMRLKIAGGKPVPVPTDDEILDKVTSILGSTCTGFEGDEVDNCSVLINEDIVYNETEYKEQNSDDDRPKVPNYLQTNKRKFDDWQDTDVGAHFLYGMATMLKSLQNKGQKKPKMKDGRFERNVAIAKYYEKKTEKLQLEIELLKMEIENKKIENNRILK